ncbi:hypothetical protein BpHYR1_019754 [Brachionus plicatilis]|uniref:Phytanoyl-CoA dioxygenase n=1 Tax=Brachionus plicatilis TaxID=10195 RepID=A0A3M7PPP9_BRAPC|nr:hypothetical protein BpHYR1_019754 [Brachionus plicatilis]
MFTDFSPQTNLSNLKSTLAEYGVAVLPGVISGVECNNLRQTLMNYISNDLNISLPNDFEKLKPLKGGIMRHYGISLLKEVLDLKTDERVKRPYEEIWNQRELTTSFDSVFFGPPPEQLSDNYFFDENRTWFHLDQASNKRDMCCVQGFINCEDTQPGDGCLSVLDKSHLFFNEFYDTFKIDTHGKDWFLLNQVIHVDWFKSKGCEWKTIMAPKRSMVFWDSRVVHMGTAPRKGRPSPNWRILAYVCYTPAQLQSRNDAKLKRNAFVDNKCTAHWPYSVRVFDNKINGFDKKNNLKDLCERQKMLFGI